MPAREITRQHERLRIEIYPDKPHIAVLAPARSAQCLSNIVKIPGNPTRHRDNGGVVRARVHFLERAQNLDARMEEPAAQRSRAAETQKHTVEHAPDAVPPARLVAIDVIGEAEAPRISNSFAGEVAGGEQRVD